MSAIAHLFAREVLDSRGNLTVEVNCCPDSGASASAIVPSGASTSALEALELRDGGWRHGAKAVRSSVSNVSAAIADDRMTKYNQLLRIAEQLAGAAGSPGRSAYANLSHGGVR